MNDNLNHITRIEEDDNDNRVAPIVRVASAAALIVDALAFPSIWKTLKSHYPKGLGDSIISISRKKPETQAETMFILGKAAFEMNQTQAGRAAYAKDVLRKESEHDAAVTHLTQVEMEDKISHDQYLDTRRAEQDVRNMTRDMKDEIYKQSLFERVAFIEKSIENKVIQADKTGFSNITTSSNLQLKKQLIIDAMSERLSFDREVYFKEFMGFTISELNAQPAELFLSCFERLMKEGTPFSKTLAHQYVRLASKRHSNLSLAVLPNGKEVRLGDIRPNIFSKIRIKEAENIRFNAAESFPGYHTKETSVKKHDRILFGETNPVDDIMNRVETNFKHLKETRVYGDTLVHMRGFMQGMYDEVSKMSKAGRAGKNFGVMLDYQNSSMVVFAEHGTNTNAMKREEIRVALPDAYRRISKSTSGKKLDTSSIVTSKGGYYLGSDFEHTMFELKNLHKSFVHATIAEPGKGEAKRLQSLTQRLYKNNLKTSSALFDHYEQSVIRNTNPLVTEKSRMRLNRASGVTQHTLMKAARRGGKPLLMVDQEFIAGREGPQVLMKNPHEASPYNVSYQKIDANGKVINQGTIWIKTDSNVNAARKYKQGKLNDPEVIKFMESLESIGKMKNADEIAESILNSTVTAPDAYKHVYNTIGGDCLLADWGGGSDRAIVKLQSGIDIGKRSSVDLMSIYKSASSTRFGWGKDPQFAKMLLNSSDKLFTEIESQMLGFTGTKAHERLLNSYRKHMKADIKDRRKLLLQAVLQEAHYPDIDTAMQTGLHQALVSHDSLLGSMGSHIDGSNRIMLHGQTSFRDKLNIINTHYTFSHFGDPNANPELATLDPTARSNRMIMRGNYAGVGASTLDLFQIGNIGLKQTHQLFQGLNMNVPDKFRQGRFLMPIVSAHRAHIEGIGKNAVGNNIAANAEPVMMKAYALPKGYGYIPEGAILGDRHILDFMNAESESEITETILGKNGQIMDSGMNDFLMDMKRRYGEKHAFFKEHPDNFLLHPEFNDLVKEHIAKTNSEVAQRMKSGLMQSGSLNDRLYQFKQGDAIVRNSFGIQKQQVSGVGRFTEFTVLHQKDKSVKVLYKLATLNAMEKTHISYTKGLVKGIGDVRTIGGRDHKLTSEQLLDPRHSYHFIFEQNFLGRAEYGTEKQDMFMRAYGKMVANGEHMKADNFLERCFPGKTYKDESGLKRVITDQATIPERVAAYNNITYDKLYHGLTEAGVVWDRHDIKLAAQHYKIKHGSDKEMANGFDKIITERWNRDNPLNRVQVAGGNYTQTLDNMMDNINLKMLRATQPFYHPTKGIVNPDLVQVARVDVDIHESEDGLHTPIMGMNKYFRAHTLMTQHTQEPGYKAKWIRGSMEHRHAMNLGDATYASGFEAQLLGKTAGKFRHNLRVQTTNYLATLQGYKALDGAVEVGSELNAIMQRTLTNNEIIKDLKDGVIDKDQINGKLFKDYQRKVLDKKNTQVYKDEAKRLTKEAHLSINDSRKSELLKQAELMNKRAELSSTRELHDFGDSITHKDVIDQVGTLYEGVDNTHYTKEYRPDSFVRIGDKKVAPQDMIRIHSKVSNIGKHNFFQSLQDYVDESIEVLGEPSARTAQTRRDLLKLTELLKHQREKPQEGFILPSPQQMMGVANLNKHALEEHSTYQGLKHAYEDILNAANEEMNFKGGYEHYDENRLEAASNDFHKRMLNTIGGKRRGKGFSLMYSKNQYMVQGIYGQLDSFTQATNVLDENLKLHQNDKSLFVAGKGEISMEKQLKTMQLMKSGEYGMIGRENFEKIMVGDTNVYKWLLKTHTKDDVRAVLAGEKPLTMVASVYPMETNEHKMRSLEFFIHNDSNRLMKNMPKGITLSSLFMEAMERDLDGDNGTIGLLQIGSINDYNKYQKYVRTSRSRHNFLISEFQKTALEVGDFKKASDIVKAKYHGKDLEGTAVTKTEAYHTSKLAETLFEKGKLRIDKNAEGVYFERNITQADFFKNGHVANDLAYGYKASEGTINEFMKKIDPMEYAHNMIARGRLQTYGAHGIGILSSHATKTGIRLNSMREYIGRLGTGELNSDVKDTLMKSTMFAGLDHSDPNAMGKRLTEVLDTHNVKMMEMIDRMGDILREPEQLLLSTKKINIEDAGRHVMRMIEGIADFHEDKYKTTRDAFKINLEESDVNLIREAKYLHETIAKHDIVYRGEVNAKIAHADTEGMSWEDIHYEAAHGFLMKHISGISKEALESVVPSVTSMRSTFADKTAMAWRDSVKQLVYNKGGKSLIGMGIGLALMTASNPNQMSGDITDFGIDLGHRPGFSSSQPSESESLNPEVGQDIYSKKWAYMLKNDPILKDNMDEYTDKSYKNLNMNQKIYKAPSATKLYKRNYIDYRKQYNKRYETNDMRRAKLATF